MAGYDETPMLRMHFGGNVLTSIVNATPTWYARKYDGSLAGTMDHEAIAAIARANGKHYDWGFYASSQEQNQTSAHGANRTESYAHRLTNDSFWVYNYAYHYLDSLGYPTESLVVHIADDSIRLVMKGDSVYNPTDYRRTIYADGANWSERAFCYQYWANNSDDSFRYESGYTNLANGYNATVRAAIAYAFRRHIYEDMLDYGDGDTISMFFMDNQYRADPRLSSYYTIEMTGGGPTSSMDWVEQPGIGIAESATVYYDKSTRMIDSAILKSLDSMAAITDHKIRMSANADKFFPQHIGKIVDYVNCLSSEGPIDYGKSWSYYWQAMWQIADTMAAHPKTWMIWNFIGDILCSSNDTSWRYDSVRIYACHLAFYFTVMDTNSAFNPTHVGDTNIWQPIYGCDFGLPAGKYVFSDTAGSGATMTVVASRKFVKDGDTMIAVMRTAYSTINFRTDSVLVDLGADYYEVTMDAETSAVAVNQVYMKPYDGWFGIQNNGGENPPAVKRPAFRGQSLKGGVIIR